MPLYFVYTMVQKIKNDQKLKSRGSALKPVEGSKLAFALKKNYLNNYKRYHHDRHTVNPLSAIWRIYPSSK